MEADADSVSVAEISSDKLDVAERDIDGDAVWLRASVREKVPLSETVAVTDDDDVPERETAEVALIVGDNERETEAVCDWSPVRETDNENDSDEDCDADSSFVELIVGDSVAELDSEALTTTVSEKDVDIDRLPLMVVELDADGEPDGIVSLPDEE